MILIIEDIDKIYNLGDNIELVMKQIKYSIQYLIVMIWKLGGNHDEAVMSLVNNTPYPEDLKDKFYEHHQWIEPYG